MGFCFFMSLKQPIEELIGKRYSLLKILGEAKTSNPKHRKVSAICECGTTKNYFLGNLKRGLTHSCGCHNIDLVRERIKKGLWVKKSNIKHGLTNHPLYWIWNGIKDRCRNPNNRAYRLYGGDGVDICKEWESDVVAFYNWAINNGWKQGLEIDKDIKGNGKLYSPETCCFVTEKENCNKRRSSKYVTWNGQTKTAAQWADEYGVSQQLFYKRRKSGWSIEDSLLTPPLKNDSTDRKPRGSNHGLSKVTEEIVLKVREMRKSTNLTNREIGAKFGISKSHVGSIVRRIIWNHI